VRKKRIILICAIVAALALTALLAYNSNFGEPSYAGHRLSYWVARLGRDPVTDENQIPAAEKAIDHIGVAALPFLVKWVQYDPAQWRVALASDINQSRFPFARSLSDLIINRRARELARGTVGAFAVLGTRAMPVFGDLCRLMNQTNALQTATVALFDLMHFGTNALPPFLALATNTQSPLRLSALSAIRTLPISGAAAEPAVPVLLQCLAETNNPSAQERAAYALGNLRAAPQVSIPALAPHLNSTDTRLRKTTIIALGQFGPQASSAVPALTNLLSNPDPSTRSYAVDALHRIDPATFTNGPGE
jgi:hypothetical protein